MNSCLVSIITPCYNAANFIAETIESVINQTLLNWELLIINDCSSDNSEEIILEFCKKDPRIKYFKTEKPSGSPALPRNIGIENAQGIYIAFLDADDLWFPEKLEKQVIFMKSNNYSLSYSYYEKINNLGKRDNRIVETSKITSYKSLLHSNTIPILTSMVTREAIGSTRFKQIPQEDFCFWLDILKKGYKAYNMCEITALYRMVENSRSTNKLAMFKGYWNVIRKQQNIPFILASYDMLTYTALGLQKYLK